MGHDLFQGRKSIHVSLEKNTHFGLRTKLFRHNISMQEVFDECARQVVEETRLGKNIIEIIVKRKLQDALEGRPKRTNNQGSFSDLDTESLYTMINSDKED